MNDRFEELAKTWFDRAQDDFLWAQDTLDDERFSGVCFLCQQSAEKALKSYLFSQKQTLIKTHNLPLLNEKCKKFDSTFFELEEAVDTLNNYYTDTRYPDIWDYTRFHNEALAKEALILTEKIVQFVNKKIT